MLGGIVRRLLFDRDHFDEPAAITYDQFRRWAADADRSRELPAVTADELADLLAKPIEDWMVYLDPSQQSLVDRVFAGPARVRAG